MRLVNSHILEKEGTRVSNKLDSSFSIRGFKIIASFFT